ncbi:MAG: transposase, partial [Pseudobdellovibrionaceae bacterium]
MTTKQLSFQSTNWKHRFAHGGSLRQLAKGRGARPLSSREPLHLVFKINKAKMRGGLRGWKSQKIIKFLFQKYAKKFFVRIDQITIQRDHIHVIVRSPRRFYFQSFFKVIAGQIAQVFQKQGLLKSDEELLKPNQGMTATPKGTGLWKYRPFS